MKRLSMFLTWLCCAHSTISVCNQFWYFSSVSAQQPAPFDGATATVFTSLTRISVLEGNQFGMLVVLRQVHDGVSAESASRQVLQI